MQAEQLLLRGPRNHTAHEVKAGILAQAGHAKEASDIYANLVKENASDPLLWVRYGNALRAAGCTVECVDAYRRAASLRPSLGEAYCSLANLKTYRFTDLEVAHIRAQLRLPDLPPESRVAFHFALGKALQDQGAFQEAFEQYTAGSALWRASLSHDPAATSTFVSRCIQVFTSEFCGKSEAIGLASTAPIFILGLPRSGSTLVEQILASHSTVEGAGELPEIMQIAAEIDRATGGSYPEGVRTLHAEGLRRLGERYITRSHPYRQSLRPHFIDKMPNNFVHVGLIHLILPNAKIVDVRRAAMACCFSNFSHHFARGQQFSYDLRDLGQYYADYVRMMKHWDEVLPGKLHRVEYEKLVQNPQAEIRLLLAHLGLPFEEACLRFFEHGRTIRSASSEQVRQPIHKEALEYWRNFEPWLGPLREALATCR